MNKILKSKGKYCNLCFENERRKIDDKFKEAVSKVIDPVILDFLPARLAATVYPQIYYFYYMTLEGIK